MPNDSIPDSRLPFGRRLRILRERRGMTTAVLGGLVGRSAEWVQHLEQGRLQQPKHPMLLQLKEALGVRDLTELADTGDAALRAFAGPGHPALPAVRDAINAAPWDTGDGPPEPLGVLQARLDAAWRARHASPDHRTVLGGILPGLIRDCQRAVRGYQGDKRRRAQAIMAGTWNLSQFFLAYQPDGGSLWRVAERGMSAATESEDPHALGGAVWLLVQAHRDAGEYDAAESVNRHALEQLGPRLARGNDEMAAMYGALLFEVAYTLARKGQRGEAWRFWDQADAVAQRLPQSYYDKMTSFSQVIMPAHAVTVAVEVRQKGEALRQAKRSDALVIPSQPRRGRHLIEVARAYRLAGDDPATLGTLQAAEREAPETIKFNGFAQQLAGELAASGPVSARREAANLARRIGIAT